MTSGANEHEASRYKCSFEATCQRLFPPAREEMLREIRPLIERGLSEFIDGHAGAGGPDRTAVKVLALE